MPNQVLVLPDTLPLRCRDVNTKSSAVLKFIFLDVTHFVKPVGNFLYRLMLIVVDVAQPSIDISLHYCMFRYSRAILQRMIALSQRYNWRETSEFTMRTSYYKHFLALQKTYQTANNTS